MSASVNCVAFFAKMGNCLATCPRFSRLKPRKDARFEYNPEIDIKIEPNLQQEEMQETEMQEINAFEKEVEAGQVTSIANMNCSRIEVPILKPATVVTAFDAKEQKEQKEMQNRSIQKMKVIERCDTEVSDDDLCEAPRDVFNNEENQSSLSAAIENRYLESYIQFEIFEGAKFESTAIFLKLELSNCNKDCGVPNSSTCPLLSTAILS